VLVSFLENKLLLHIPSLAHSFIFLKKGACAKEEVIEMVKSRSNPSMNPVNMLNPVSTPIVKKEEEVPIVKKEELPLPNLKNKIQIIHN